MSYYRWSKSKTVVNIEKYSGKNIRFRSSLLYPFWAVRPRDGSFRNLPEDSRRILAVAQGDRHQVFCQQQQRQKRRSDMAPGVMWHIQG